MKVIIVIDSYGWVQERKARLIRDRIGREKVEICNIREFKGRHCFREDIFYFVSWRSYLRISVELPGVESNLDLSSCIAGVTSHYNVGGGLDPSMTVSAGKSLYEEVSKAKEILSRFGLVLVNSKELESYLASIGLGNICCIQNGVDTSFFKRDKDMRVKSQECLVKDVINVGWSGKAKGAKNIRLLEEIEEYYESDKRIKIVRKQAARSGKPWEWSKSWVQRHFGISKQNMRSYYTSLDFNLITSLHEGTPNPLLEAGSMGIPSIATRVGNVGEIVEDGVNGFIIEPSLESAVSAIERAFSMTYLEYSNMSKSIEREIRTNWEWKDKLEQYDIIIRGFAKGCEQA